MRAAAGDEAAARAVAEEVNQLGWREWAREAIRARIDPLLAAAVLPERVRVEVARILNAFYAMWGGWSPREYERVRGEWRVQRDRWQGGSKAPAYEELLAAVGAPAPALAGTAVAARARAASAFAATGEDRDVGRRPPASAEASSPGGGQGAQAAAAGAMGGGLGHDGPLSSEDATRDAGPEVTPNADGGDTPARDETGGEGLGETTAGGVDGVEPEGTRVTAEIGAEALDGGPWMERLREARGRGGAAAVKRLKEAWLAADELWDPVRWPEPAVSRTHERAGR